MRGLLLPALLALAVVCSLGSGKEASGELGGGGWRNGGGAAPQPLARALLADDEPGANDSGMGANDGAEDSQGRLRNNRPYCVDNLECENGKHCSAQGRCVADHFGGVVERSGLFPLWASIISALAAAICGYLCFFVCFESLKGANGDYEQVASRHPVLGIAYALCVVGVPLALGFGLRHPAAIPLREDIGTGPPCAELYDLDCAPFTCDLRNGFCFESCELRSDCSGNAAQCTDGACWPSLGTELGFVALPVSTNTTECQFSDEPCYPFLCNADEGRCGDRCIDGNNCASGVCSDGECRMSGVLFRYTFFSLLAMGAISCAFCIVCSCTMLCCVVCVFRLDPEFEGPFLYHLLTVCCVGLCCGLFAFIVLTIPKGEGYEPDPGDGEFCVDLDAVACVPYICDQRNGLCLTSCNISAECQGDADCIDNICAETYDPDGTVVPGLAAVAVPVALGLLMLVGASVWISHFEAHPEHRPRVWCKSARWAMWWTFLACVAGMFALMKVLTSLSAEDPTRLNFPLTDGLYVPYLTSCGLFVVTYTASLALARVLTRRRIDWHAAWTGHGATGGLIWAVFATVVLVALFVALCGGLAVAWSIRDATPVTIAGDGIDCRRQDSARCGSYFCDSANDQCYTSCETDDHCRTGYLCSNALRNDDGSWVSRTADEFAGDDPAPTGQCTPAVRDRNMDTGKFGVLFGIALIVTCYAALFVAGHCSGGTRWRPWSVGMRLARAKYALYCVAIFVMICIQGLFVLLRKTTEYPVGQIDASPGSPNCSATVDFHCFPYYCSTPDGKCMATCESDHDCRERYFCDPDAICRAHAQLQWIIPGCLAGLAFLLFIGLYFRHLLKKHGSELRRQQAYVTQLQEENERLEAFEARLAKVRVAELDAWPAAMDDAHDCTRVDRTPAHHSGDGRDSDDGSRAPPQVDPICCICFTEESTVRLTQACSHGFCTDCAARAMQAIIDADQFPARCPGCQAEMALADPRGGDGAGVGSAGGSQGEDREDLSSIGSLISAATVEFLVMKAVVKLQLGRRFLHLQLLKAFSPQDVVTCPACKLLCVKPETVKRAEAQEAAAAAAAASGGEVSPEGKPAAEAFKVECPHCEEQYCHRCLAFWFDHDGYTCEEWEDARDRGADRQTERELRRGHKSCPNCGTLFVHYRGHACHHIKPNGGCPSCGHHFCCVCLGPHPCNSPDHGLFCDDRCDCPTCGYCRPGQPCAHCSFTPACPACFPNGDPDGFDGEANADGEGGGDDVGDVADAGDARSGAGDGDLQVSAEGLGDADWVGIGLDVGDVELEEVDPPSRESGCDRGDDRGDDHFAAVSSASSTSSASSEGRPHGKAPADVEAVGAGRSHSSAGTDRLPLGADKGASEAWPGDPSTTAEATTTDAVAENAAATTAAATASVAAASDPAPPRNATLQQVRGTFVYNPFSNKLERRLPPRVQADRLAEFQHRVGGGATDDEAANYLATFNWQVDPAVSYFREQAGPLMAAEGDESVDAASGATAAVNIGADHDGVDSA